MRKAELIEALVNIQRPIPAPRKNIPDQPQRPIPEPRKSLFKSFKDLLGIDNNSVREGIKKFSDLIISYLPKPIKNIINRVFNEEEEDYFTAEEEEEEEEEEDYFTAEEEEEEEEDFTAEEQQTALKGYLKTYRIDGQKGYDPKTFINNIKPKVLDLIKQQKKPLKVKFIFTCKFIKENPATRQIDENSGYFHSTVETITKSTDFSDSFNTMTNRLLESIQQFQNQGSGWQFDQVEYFDINIDPFEPLSGSSYITLPSKLASKKAIINVKNEKDHECFKWAVTSAVYTQDVHPERLNKQMRENSNNFDWSGIEFPVSLKQIDKFEKQNPYVINVYGYEGDVYPLKISKKRGGHVINLLIISNDETNHYCWIKNMSKLLSSQVNNHQHVRIFCYRCINSFQSKASLEKHLEYCNTKEEVKN